ncbi:Glu/Leu/Phe/Val family dehydrogenase [Synoicihabitans lomoniglobus]|uniref:Glutamate dehydrogenase n=1 Tax=Synoicihabitans lomoniglobus TaxID=2909285 RepID=A0AAF0CT81_9BACT|nr:Glu/Leu/Phe/Val dehydrogenase [Opitutaceae bacterium LMO-M01]WED67461.1 Glu/Leu/Phe/Val dehydrogenase [Opitutaceae bacterium LMO-M01]
MSKVIISSLYSSDVFTMACRQFDQAADAINLPESLRDRTKYPRRCVAFSLPIQRDDGSVTVFEGYRVQHNLSTGPSKGGIRFHQDVTLGEVAALSMWMSWKCSLMGIPYGGAKGGVIVNPDQLTAKELERLARRYMQELIPFIGPDVDVPAPDMGTNEQMMGWMMDTYSNHVGHIEPAIVTGKPIALGGSAGRREATGAGVAYLVKLYLEDLKIPLGETTVAIQGFGNVGSEAALALVAYGAKVIAISDWTGGIYNAKGIDIGKALQYIASEKVLTDFDGGDQITNDELLALECTVLIPAALPRVIKKDNADKVRCRILAEGANGPTTNLAERMLIKRGDVLIIPDVLCNAGGVTVSYFEWLQNRQNYYWDREEVMAKLFKILLRAKNAVEAQKAKFGFSRRLAAQTLGIQRVADAKASRGLFP